MFTASLPSFDYRDPWLLSFSERLRKLTRGSPRAAYFYDKPDTSTFRYRVFNVCQALELTPSARASASWFTSADLDQMDHVLDLCDVLVLCRTRYNDRIARLVQAAHARGRRVLFDVDDLVFDTRYAHLILDTLDSDLGQETTWNDWYAYVGRMAAAFQLCDGAIVTNPYLAERAREAFGDSRSIAEIPNFLEQSQEAYSARLWAAKEASGWQRGEHITLGYFSGTPTHNRDFAIVSGPLARLMDEDPRINLRIAGFLDIGPELTRHIARIEVFPLQDYMNLQKRIAEVELNLVPLQDNVFTNCKSELKWFDAAIVGSLTIATPTYTYRNAIEHEVNGWLAASQDWSHLLRAVVSDIEGHSSVLQAARAAAIGRYSHAVQSDVITRALFEHQAPPALQS